MEFDVVIGLETHVLNEKALEYAIKASLALNCTVHELSCKEKLLLSRLTKRLSNFPI